MIFSRGTSGWDPKARFPPWGPTRPVERERCPTPATDASPPRRKTHVRPRPGRPERVILPACGSLWSYPFRRCIGPFCSERRAPRVPYRRESSPKTTNGPTTTPSTTASRNRNDRSDHQRATGGRSRSHVGNYRRLEGARRRCGGRGTIVSLTLPSFSSTSASQVHAEVLSFPRGRRYRLV